jgi:hypothetical protein
LHNPQRHQPKQRELDQEFPLDTLVQRYWLPTIRAGVALERGEPNQAIELLKVASTMELGEISQCTIFLCPAYLRGEVYLKLRDGNREAAEFEKFVDHRGVVATSASCRTWWNARLSFRGTVCSKTHFRRANQMS